MGEANMDTTKLKFRVCPHNNNLCTCSDTEAQPCVAALVDKYLEALRWNIMTNDDDCIEITARRDDLKTIDRVFTSVAEFKSWAHLK
jgi:hypothetical protein